MFTEDNSGYIFFPYGDRMNVSQGDKTLIYLVAFDPKHTLLSNVHINLPGDFVSDDVWERKLCSNLSDNEKIQTLYDQIYFPNINGEKLKSAPLVTSICIGWSDCSFEFKDGTPWVASFRDLTEEGKKLYYSIKKLHNNKEVRILTFNNI